MEIVQRPSTQGLNTRATAKPAAGQAESALADANGPVEQGPAAGATAQAPLRRGLSKLDAPLQNDVSGAQQAIDFLEQTAAQLRALKTDLAAKLATRQMRDGQVEQRVRQFADTWRTRAQASGGTLDAQLNYSSQPAMQRFTVRGMTLANLRNGARETLAISVGGGTAGLRSVHLAPGLSDAEIVARFDQALAPAGVRVSLNNDGELAFSTPESAWPAVRDSLAVQGAGIRFPAGQLNRIKAEPEAPVMTPEGWGTSDIESMRATLQQVTQALAHVEAALSKVRQELAAASQRVQAELPEIEVAGMGQMAEVFASFGKEPGYAALVSLTSALVGINRDRVVSLLRLS
jgi:prefoldin subunit 5